MWRATVFKSVLSLKLKIFARKSTTLEKLANGRYVFEVQPTGTMVVDSLSERIQSIRVSVDFFADFHGKCQSDDEAKYNICSVFNDTSHFQCLVTAHKLAVSSRVRPRERRKTSLILEVLILQNLKCFVRH